MRDFRNQSPQSTHKSRKTSFKKQSIGYVANRIIHKFKKAENFFDFYCTRKEISELFFRYRTPNSQDVRSFRSLENHIGDNNSAIVEEEEIFGTDSESVSTFRSLPSTIEENDSGNQILENWHVQGHDVDAENEYNHTISTSGFPNYLSANFGSTPGRESSISIIEDGGEDFNYEKTTATYESKKLIRFSFPLILNFILEQTFPLVCVIFAGHLGKQELAAVSLASMISAIILSIYEGMATALDTLCPQAYGAGQFSLVGIQTQRCACFSLLLFVPAGLFWWNTGPFLRYIIEDERVIQLTEQFLRVLIFGAPPYILFEDGKHSKVLGFGFIGAAVAAAVNYWLTLIFLVLFVMFIDGKQCWEGLTRQAFTDWAELSALAFPGVIMLLAESMAYEVLTLLASYFGTNELAAQSALSSVVSLLYMIPFALSVASSTRIANFVGSGNISSANVAVHVGMTSAVLSALVNSTVIFLFSRPIAKLFTDDATVQDEIISLCPLMSLFVVFDGWACVASGILRALGLQGIGGTINMVGYYLISLPLALLLGFTLRMQLAGLWIGNGAGLLLIGIAETWVIYTADWDAVISDAKNRNTLEDSD
ncbi:hypothetical protein HII12_004221 [Brettanomyces bruxellensis]|uniref:Uncharacterized protein n=1 Tax=Dekkera bruxellensis TaxID=5007 RepID=A0A8H6BBF5_DEKBR|nr:hypothetical protein HII12_004221 [Brettanomyces bruxellensis]